MSVHILNCASKGVYLFSLVPRVAIVSALVLCLNSCADRNVPKVRHLAGVQIAEAEYAACERFKALSGKNREDEATMVVDLFGRFRRNPSAQPIIREDVVHLIGKPDAVEDRHDQYVYVVNEMGLETRILAIVFSSNGVARAMIADRVR
jgi:hypothetical protein